MKVKAVTRFVFKNKEYKSLKDIQAEIHNIIGEEVLDRINKTIEIRHKDLLPLLQILCSKEVRETLTECLNVTYEQEPDYEDDNTTEINILDI